MPIELQTPKWAKIVLPSECWKFRDSVLIHKDYECTVDGLGESSSIQKAVVARFWAAQKNSTVVQNKLGVVLASLEDGGWGVNIGAGHTRLHKKILNVDLFDGSEIDVVNVGTKLPFLDGSIKCVVSQEVLEHVSRPAEYIREAYRVLEPGGLFFCQVPFVIGYHPGPHDYWRFTREGLQELFKQQDWELLELAPTLGHGSGFYRVLVEFLGVNASILSRSLYRPVKGAASILLYPLQWLDFLTKYSDQQDRIAGGYYCIVRKPAMALIS